MAKKINVAVVKEFLFNHGEKVALGTCAFLALFFGVMGLFRAMGAGRADGSTKTWAEELKGQEKRVQDSMAGQTAPMLPDDVKASMDPVIYEWHEMRSNYVSQPYNIQAEPNTSKRTNPKVLPIKANGSRQIQLDYIRSLVYVHDITETGYLRCLPLANAVDMVAPVMPKNPKGKLPKGQPQAPVVIPPVMRKGVPVRMVVVSAVFPMKQQVEEFQKALRMNTQEDMFKIPQEDLPYVLGINVIKYEIVNKKKVDEQGEDLILVDSTSKEKVKDKPVKKGKALDDLLRIAIYDEDTPEMLMEYIHHGLNTPWPKLANARYPKFNFDGFDIAWDEEEAMKKDVVVGPKDPMTPTKLPGLGDRKGKKGPMPLEGDPRIDVGDRVVKEINSKDVKLADLPLYNRLFSRDPKLVNKYNIFHVLGHEQPPKEEAVAANPRGIGVPPAGGMQPKTNDPDRFFSAWKFGLPNAGAEGPGVPMQPFPPKDKKGGLVTPQQATYPNWDRDALVRFVDPGAVPGKTYQYAIQVRMANPNFGKNNSDIAFGDLARLEELPPSPWVETPTITIPQEYFLYAVDQQHIDEVPHPKSPVKVDKEHTSFQIHQWTPTCTDDNNGPEFVIGDWVIGERIAVRRGEAIGSQVYARAPIWLKKKDAFEIPILVEGNNPKAKQTKKPGFRIDFKRDGERPILVDFVGGKRLKADNKLDEETAVDALVLSADGKLTVLNSRADAEAFQVDVPNAVSRQDRVLEARKTVNAVGAVHTPVDPKGMKLPIRGGS